jgi:hypothetical protein
MVCSLLLEESPLVSCVQRFGMAVDPLKDTQPRRAVLVLERSDRSNQMRPREFASIDLHLAGHRTEGPRSELFQAAA